MNSLFQGKRVAFSGCIPLTDKNRLLSHLKQCGANYCICASNIDYLIVGPDYLEKYKKHLKPLHILPFQKVLDTIPVPQTSLWVDSYRPKLLSEIIGQKTSIDSLLSWLRAWPPADGPRGALVTGPPGIGKTTATHLAVKHAGFELVELNASNERSGLAIRRWFEEASRSGCVGKRRVIVMDEVDGMSSGDRGGVGELARIIRVCSFPIICIANDRTPKLRPLVSCCLDVRFSRPTKTVIAKTLMATVVKDQRLTVNASALETLCERNGNDIRSILNFLQFSSRSSSPSSAGGKDELLRIDAFSAAGRLFGSSGSTLEYRSNLVFVDFGLIPLMVAEGYIGAAAKSLGDEGDRLGRCIRGADCLGDWDIIDTRLRKTQSWNLLPSATLAVVAAAKAVEGPAPFQIFPSWLGKNSKRLKHVRNLSDMRRRAGISSMSALQDSLDLLRTVLFRKQTAEEIITCLDELRLTRDDMLETLVDTAFTGCEYTMDSKLKSSLTREWKKRHKDEDVRKCEDVDDDCEDAESVDLCFED